MRPIVACVLLLALLLAPAAAERSVLTGKEAAEGTAAFGADLYRALSGRPGNLFLSPYSVAVALSMVREGAVGATGDQMDRVLHMPGGPCAPAWKEIGEALVPGKVADPGADEPAEVDAFRIAVANAVWAQEGLGLDDEYEWVLDKLYSAPPRRIDFRETEKARAAINGWVAENTHDRIRNIVPEDLPTPDTLLALANAIWFKASWEHPFEERWTADAAFTTAAGAEAKCRLMHRLGSYRYAEADGVQVLEIPYRGAETSMVVLLPRAKDGLPALEAALSGKKLGEWIGALDRREVRVKVPKFRFEVAFDLADSLRGLGMTDAFTPGKADFTGITKAAPLVIGPVLHKAFVAVDEAGTEAAAATVVMMLKGAAPADSVVEFTADHPFLFLIRHVKSGTVLFLGRVSDPSGE